MPAALTGFNCARSLTERIHCLCDGAPNCRDVLSDADRRLVYIDKSETYGITVILAMSPYMVQRLILIATGRPSKRQIKDALR